MKQKTDVAIGVDVTEEGAHVVAMQLRPDGKNVVIYSQFHPLALPQRKPLTDEQIEKICRAVDGNEFPIDFCREIEAAHGIK